VGNGEELNGLRTTFPFEKKNAKSERKCHLHCSKGRVHEKRVRSGVCSTVPWMGGECKGGAQSGHLSGVKWDRGCVFMV